MKFRQMYTIFSNVVFYVNNRFFGLMLMKFVGILQVRLEYLTKLHWLRI